MALLRREPDNVHDGNAIRVDTIQGVQVLIARLLIHNQMESSMAF